MSLYQNILTAKNLLECILDGSANKGPMRSPLNSSSDHLSPGLVVHAIHVNRQNMKLKASLSYKFKISGSALGILLL